MDYNLISGHSWLQIASPSGASESLPAASSPPIIITKHHHHKQPLTITDSFNQPESTMLWIHPHFMVDLPFFAINQSWTTWLRPINQTCRCSHPSPETQLLTRPSCSSGSAATPLLALRAWLGPTHGSQELLGGTMVNLGHPLPCPTIVPWWMAINGYQPSTAIPITRRSLPNWRLDQQ